MGTEGGNETRGRKEGTKTGNEKRERKEGTKRGNEKTERKEGTKAKNEKRERNERTNTANEKREPEGTKHEIAARDPRPGPDPVPSREYVVSISRVFYPKGTL